MVSKPWISRILIIVFYFKVNVADVLVNKLNNYGPYDVEFTRCEMCAGSKSKNLTYYTLDTKKIGADFIVYINFTFLAPSHIDEVKLTIFGMKGHQKTTLFNYRINDPCKHFAFAAIIEKLLNASKCSVRKGNYEVSVNFSEVTRSFYGTSFFYGDFTMKASATSKQGNIICLITNSVFTKKT